MLTDEEIEYRMKQEYQAYLDEEAAFLRELGLLKEEDEPLPETWPPRALTPPPPHWSMAVQQMFCDTDTVPDKRRICRIYSLLYGRYIYIEWWLVM